MPFHIAGNYVGTGSPTSLNYEGHPAYDYAFGKGTKLYAAADGIVDEAVHDPPQGKKQGRSVGGVRTV
jgi:murein DD-endopeptidase MepM/ murein hydrolase activator NlpD